MSMTERIIDTRETALFFAEFTKVKYLQPFLLAEYSLSEAAKRLSISKTRMSYWVTKMQEFNLINVVRIEKRGKHNVPIYRATADVFRVPLELLPIESDEALLEAHTKTFEQTVKRSLAYIGRRDAEGWHIYCYVREGRVRLDIAPGSGDLDDAKIVNHFGRLRLSEGQAKTLRQEMKVLLERFVKESAQNKEEKSYLFKLLLVEEWLE
jgi:hypothetical protein